MEKQIARLSDLKADNFVRCMIDINQIAQHGNLEEYTTFSRIWEYPWLWFQLKTLNDKVLKVLDIGSQRSPFPWFIGSKGFNVIISDQTVINWRNWQKAREQLKVNIDQRLLDAQILDLPTASIDIYLSISVLEHIPNKTQAVAEAARVLRPGGLFILTFDICEPDMGMTFPQWNGKALTMAEFDNLFKLSPWFEEGIADLPWNTSDIPDYLAWHRTTAPHHNYVTGAAIIRRNDKIWKEPIHEDYLRIIRGKFRTVYYLSKWYLRNRRNSLRQIFS